VPGDVLDEVLPVQPLALQPALHVGDRDDHGVDDAALDPVDELVHRQVPAVAESRLVLGHAVP